jgi:hypothetical protein
MTRSLILALVGFVLSCRREFPIGRDDQPPACAALTCPRGSICADDPSDDCNPEGGDGDCRATCVMDPNVDVQSAGRSGDPCGSFLGTPCQPGFVCVDNPADDCDPNHGGADCDGICISRRSDFIPCGGFPGQQCPTGYLCVDDPSDDCDPNHGGADCGGICVAPPLTCGGFAGVGCPDGFTCIDNPWDDCDPAQGAADCVGICQ